MTDLIPVDESADQLEPGQWASVLVQFLENRNGRALIRLPNGSKTSVDSRALHPMVVEFHVRREPSDEQPDIGPGDIYEDCAYHPVLCTRRDGDDIEGISLIDGSRPRSCSMSHCGVEKLEIADVATAIERAMAAKAADVDMCDRPCGHAPM